MAHLLIQLERNPEGMTTRANGIFKPFVQYGLQQQNRLDVVLGGVHRLVHEASALDDPDMRLALLRLTGPRLEATLLGTQLLAAWVDFLRLVEATLQGCPFYGVERMVRDTDRVRQKVEPALSELSSLEPKQFDTVARTHPERMKELTREFDSTLQAVQLAAKRGEQVLLAQQLLEMLTLTSATRMLLPRSTPATPAVLGAGLVMGSGGVMMGSQVVVSAEWLEAIRQLIQAGVISVPVASAVVKGHASQVMLSQSHDDLPKGVQEALGEGPEVRGMRQTSKAGAGMSESPRHHVLPREFREWFEQRGFTGEMNIDQFCVRLEQASHQAIHGGGDWRLGRMWPGEWNQMIMSALRKTESRTGRMLTRPEVLDIVASYMKRYGIPMRFTPGSGR